MKYSRLKQFALRVCFPPLFNSKLQMILISMFFRSQLRDEFAMSQALASTLDEEELADLRDQFHAIDVDKNGAISLEEMRQVCFLHVL